MLENEKDTNEVADEELDAVAGGGIYTRDGFLKTTWGYSCGHYVCKECGKTGIHHHSKETYQYMEPQCRTCSWHSTLRCGNPANKR